MGINKKGLGKADEQLRRQSAEALDSPELPSVGSGGQKAATAAGGALEKIFVSNPGVLSM